MNKSTSLTTILQQVLPEEIMQIFMDTLGFIDVARKFTVYNLFLFLSEAAFQEWKGYRDGEQRMGKSGLQPVNYSTISKKAKVVPFELFKQLLHFMIKQCNRKTRRSLGIPQELLIVDSTKITTGLGRMSWAPLKGEKAGVKLHVALLADRGELYKVTETTGNDPDMKSCPILKDCQRILVADRAYGKHAWFDDYQEQKERQYFVIRLRDNTTFQESIHRERKRPFEGTILQDFTCQLGKKKALTRNRFRVVILHDPNGNPVILGTNLHWHSAEKIADIYKQRWQIEVFFRWIKQHLNIPMLFGTTPNAVYGQLYTALLVYVLLKFLFDQGNTTVHKSARLTFVNFARKFSLQELPPEWRVFLSSGVIYPADIPIFG